MLEQPFAECENCREKWNTRVNFLTDFEIVLVGYQANFIAPEKGLFLFNHSCHGTLSLEVQTFADLYSGPIFEKQLSGSDSCAGYCLHRNSLSRCPQKCECAYVREILHIVGRRIRDNA